ncbi:glycosyltransferase [Sulfuricurvum sp.]|uniref:glycosyltransferase n=1 Tax=Sulfuricurvum sp. TaxID=2025608 RepID=UPI00263803D0|nr:glycosyltransferase [Sulfuricurvum sp.]MDD3597486.1 glycosyltransferase [Sulfuricurvum sp.]
MSFSPIVLFVYNRPWHTQQTIEALQKNDFASESDLFIFSDAEKDERSFKKVKEVRNYIKRIDGFKKITIIERETNWGLANSIIDGVTKIVNEYGKIIVLEDDLVTSPYFLKFMNETLEMYQNEEKVACVHGYIYPIENLPETFFIRGADCWGWATWKRGWDIFESDGQKLLSEVTRRGLQKEADFDNNYGYTKMLLDQINGKNNSWAVRWYFSAFLKEMLCLYPGKSFVQNIGNDASGTHCSSTNDYQIALSKRYNLEKIPVIENQKSREKMEHFFQSLQSSLLRKILSKLKRRLI